ncbi:beta-lactamase hydrolase domain-containing protein [Novosphingobium aquimarinum]|uniref:beta-lactamase hydrolase domain-containing protein n=1 Tax=Novosphingobium aquimarinum TaxID=2682494 RepID=UPI0012EB8484|nr:sulfur transferase domain-containing protein [Novosphingobium aquimarinum]
MEDPSHIACWQRLDARTTTSGKLVADDIASLDALGVRHVINLALDSSPHALVDEAKLLAARDIDYTHIPVPFEAPEDAHYAAFRKAYEDTSEPVHVHCIMNWRVSAFFYRYHRDVVGMPEAEARALMERQWAPDQDERYASVWGAFIARGA